MATKPRPIESFGAELLAALLEGAKRPIYVKLPYKKAVHFTQRVNFMRREMQRQNHPEYPAAAMAKLTINWPEDTPILKSRKGVAVPVDRMTMCTVTIAPADNEFASAVRAAGVQLKELSADPLDTKAPASAPPSDPFDDILRSYVEDKA
jgi:hypothetical protein